MTILAMINVKTHLSKLNYIMQNQVIYNANK